MRLSIFAADRAVNSKRVASFEWKGEMRVLRGAEVQVLPNSGLDYKHCVGLTPDGELLKLPSRSVRTKRPSKDDVTSKVFYLWKLRSRETCEERQR